MNPTKSGVGYIETDATTRTIGVKQHAIAKELDLISSQNAFSLTLAQFGPYVIKYNPNGRRLLLGGRRGHLAAFDHAAKTLVFEAHVQDAIRDITWLHDETMCAVAQKNKVFVYDSAGIELHRIKCADKAVNLEFLQNHFLLAAGRKFGSLTYFDTSTGTLISDIKTNLGRPAGMCQNIQNGLIALGHHSGCVTMWSPKQDQPLVKMLCHTSQISSLAIDHTGKYMATGDMARFVKIWDLRTFKIVNQLKVFKGPQNMCFSQTGFLALSLGNRTDIYKDVDAKPEKYLRHDISDNHVSSLQFCPFEDILGIGHENGFFSMIVPGAGEPNIDSLNPNPYQTKQQRKEYGVKKLLEKIQPEMISLDSEVLAKVTEPEKSFKEIQEEITIKRLFPSKSRSKNPKKASKVGRQIHEQISREKRRMQLVQKVKNKK